MTAVEFLLNLVVGEDSQGKDVRVKDCINVDKIIQAKEMEKEQRENDLKSGFETGRLYQGREGDTTLEQLKSKTFKSE